MRFKCLLYATKEIVQKSTGAAEKKYMPPLTKGSFHIIDYFRWRRETRAAQTTRNINFVFTEEVANQRTISRWDSCFEGRKQKWGSGTPPNIDYQALLTAIKRNPEATIVDLDRTLWHSSETIWRRLSDPGYRINGHPLPDRCHSSP